MHQIYEIIFLKIWKYISEWMQIMNLYARKSTKNQYRGLKWNELLQQIQPYPIVAKHE